MRSRRVCPSPYLLLALFAILPSTAFAQTAASGTVSWGAFNHFAPVTGEIVFLDFNSGQRTTAALGGLASVGNKSGSYSTTLTTGDSFFVTAVLADCKTDPETCGTPANPGTRVRLPGWNGGAPFTVVDAQPVTLDLVATAESDTNTVCGAITVSGGTFTQFAFQAVSFPHAPDIDFVPSVYSAGTAIASKYCFATNNDPSPFASLDWTLTFTQTKLPACPHQLAIQNSEVLLLTPPITHDIHYSLPGAPGEIQGRFSIAGFDHDGIGISATGPAVSPDLAGCAGLSSFSANGGAGPLPFDFTPAASGNWLISGGAGRSRVTPDGLFFIQSNSMSLPLGGVSFVVAPGARVTPAISYAPAIVEGKIAVDARRWGGAFIPAFQLPSFEVVDKGYFGATIAGTSSFTTGALPLHYEESYAMYPDAQANLMAVACDPSEGVGANAFLSTPSGFDSWGFRTASLPSYRKTQPVLDAGSGVAQLVLAGVKSGEHVKVDLPAVDYRVATIALGAPTGAGGVSWYMNGPGEYSFPGGDWFSSGTASAFTFDGSAAVALGKLPPGHYVISGAYTDANFNSFNETRPYDLEQDDDVASDFGAPVLTNVQPIPSLHDDDEDSFGRKCRMHAPAVTGHIQSNDPTVKTIRVTINGSVVPLAKDGSFTANATIGTAPLIIIATDDQGRATTLKRFFTTISGLYAPANGADLVSQGEALNLVVNPGPYLLPTPKNAFKVGKPVPLTVAGALGDMPVTNANAKAPQIVALFNGGAQVPLNAIDPTLGAPHDTGLLFHYGAGPKQWTYDLNTVGLQPGTYVIQIQFWDDRILEAAIVLK